MDAGARPNSRGDKGGFVAKLSLPQFNIFFLELKCGFVVLVCAIGSICCFSKVWEK